MAPRSEGRARRGGFWCLQTCVRRPIRASDGRGSPGIKCALGRSLRRLSRERRQRPVDNRPARLPPTPDIRDSTTQNLTDGELFYAIEQGIPWTAMPAWSNGTPEGERESWALVRFIRHLPSLTPEELKEMDRFKPVSPAERQREHEIDDFLNGPPRKGSGQGREGSR